MIAFLSLVATTEAQSYGIPASQQPNVGQFSDLPGYRAPEPAVEEDFATYGDDNDLFATNGDDNDAPAQMNPLIHHVAGTHYHGTTTAIPAPGANPIPKATFRGAAMSMLGQRDVAPAPKGTPSSVGPSEPGCVNPCQGFSIWNTCYTTLCPDADRQRINQEWQQPYRAPGYNFNTPNNYQSLEIQPVEPSPVEAALSQTLGNLIANKDRIDQTIEVETDAEIAELQLKEILEENRVKAAAEATEALMKVKLLGDLETKAVSIVENEAEFEEEQLMAAPFVQALVPAVNQQFVNQVQQPGVGYQTIEDGRNFPDTGMDPRPAQTFSGYRETQPLHPNMPTQENLYYSYGPGEGDQEFQQPSNQQFMGQPQQLQTGRGSELLQVLASRQPQQPAYVPAPQSLYPLANADEQQYAGPEYQTPFQ